MLLISLAVLEPLIAVNADNTVPASYYIPTVCQKIRKFWRPPDHYTGQTLLVSFKVYRNGSVSDIRCKATNDPAYIYWRSATDAVRRALPLPRPSEEFFQKKQQFAEVSIDFSAFYYNKGAAHANDEIPSKSYVPPRGGLPVFNNR